MVNTTLSFWKTTFDLSAEPLVYSGKLREVMARLKKRPGVVLNLPGLEVCIHWYLSKLDTIGTE